MFLHVPLPVAHVLLLAVRMESKDLESCMLLVLIQKSHYFMLKPERASLAPSPSLSVGICIGAFQDDWSTLVSDATQNFLILHVSVPRVHDTPSPTPKPNLEYLSVEAEKRKHICYTIDPGFFGHTQLCLGFPPCFVLRLTSRGIWVPEIEPGLSGCKASALATILSC